jgi:hypothetical protein
MLGGPRGGAWRRAAAVNVTSGSTGNKITRDTTDIAYDGVSVSGPTFTINSGYGGWWAITLMVEWSAAAGANGFVQIDANGFLYRAQCTTSNASANATVTAVVPLAAGQTFEFAVFQNSGSTISYKAKMHAVWLGPSA